MNTKDRVKEIPRRVSSVINSVKATSTVDRSLRWSMAARSSSNSSLSAIRNWTNRVSSRKVSHNCISVVHCGSMSSN
ncbi:hypothetical protein LguiB_011977 [Lonicera macranthoides]